VALCRFRRFRRFAFHRFLQKELSLTNTTHNTHHDHRQQAEAGMAPELKARIDELISSNKVVVFIKGTKQFPQCGFSNTVVQVRAAAPTRRVLQCCSV
jgi:hypothetical protein